MLRNGIHPPRRLPDEQKQALDAIDDLSDYVTDPANGARTEAAATALAALNHLYRHGMAEAAIPALRGVESLKRRNSHTLGQDVPINHLTVYKQLRDILETLEYCIERDFHKYLDRTGRGGPGD